LRLKIELGVPNTGAGAWRDFVIVPEAQRAPAEICIRWGETMLGLEPMTPITRKRVKEPAFDHDFLREFCRLS
jgi:hypothetical protein